MELADFIYFCLLILLILCDSSTLPWETAYLKMNLNCSRESMVSADGTLTEYFQTAVTP